MALKVIVVGGGAAGFFGAIQAAERGAEVLILEKGARVLDKVRISGGGRCNVTHACFEPREFAQRYPRGGRALLPPFSRFSARDTVAWFAAREVRLKAEPDGRMFPVTDSSQTIIDCLQTAARQAGVQVLMNHGVKEIRRLADGRFEVLGDSGQSWIADRLLLATGGCRAAAAGQLAVNLGHSIEPPVPSLFTFQINTPWLAPLAGVAAEVQAEVPGTKLRERGPALVTHWGLSGPAILRLSAWGARELAALDYRFPLLVNWLPQQSVEPLLDLFRQRRVSDGAKLVANVPIAPLTLRLWEQLVQAAGINREVRWSALSKEQMQALLKQLTRTEFQVTGKSLNKDEFVTCGGIKLAEVDFKTLQSKLCPGLYFAGELLDIDGITGGFNFQAAWTTGFVAGQAMTA